MIHPLTRRSVSPTHPQAPVLRTAVENGRAVLLVRGDLDLLAVEPVVSHGVRLLRRHEKGLTVDLSAVAFFDASGIRTLLMLRRAAALDGRLVLREPSRAVLWVLKLVDMDRVFAIEAQAGAWNAARYKMDGAA